jgi:hypothetical protein
LQFEGTNEEEDVFRKIVEIEKASWKPEWNLRRYHVCKDGELFDLWKWSSLVIRTCPDFKRTVRFLELNNHPIAYSLVFQHNETAYIYKTSYNDQYKRLYPGIYIINKTINDLFNLGNVKLIDFMTNKPFMTRWTAKHLSRIRISLTKDFVPIALESTVQQPQIKRVMEHLIPYSGLIGFLYKI